VGRNLGKRGLISGHFRGQVSVEYMMIIGFATMVTIPLILIYYNYSAESTDLVSTGQAMNVARKIVDASEAVYYLGEPSQTTLKVNFPTNIYIVNLTGKEVLFKMQVKNGLTDIVQLSSVNITGNLPSSQGVKIITVTARTGYVEVTSN
jgi:hypothetical protein